jgi:hypothetical protein
VCFQPFTKRFYVLWVTRVLHEVVFEICLKSAQQAFKGAAVKVFQHTQPSLGTILMQLAGLLKSAGLPFR